MKQPYITSNGVIYKNASQKSNYKKEKEEYFKTFN